MLAVPAPRLARGIRSAEEVLQLPLIADLAVQGWRDPCRMAGLRVGVPDERYMFSDSTDMLAAAEQGSVLYWRAPRSCSPGWTRAP